MANTMKALQTVTVGAGGAATVTFSNIPQTYTDLVLMISSRTNKSGVDGGDYLYINGVATNRTGKRIYGTGSGTASDTIGDQSGFSNGNTTTANTFSNSSIYISNYATNNFKSLSYDSVTENNATTAWSMLGSNVWSSTAPVTSLTLYPDTPNYLQYSTFTLYGVFNQDVSVAPSAPTIGTASDGGTGTSASVAFTGVSGAASYTATSSPGGFTGTAAASPITVTGLTTGTAYTFTVKANNPIGSSAASAASNSVTPAAPGVFESIATATGSGQTSITFSSIPSTYKHLQVRIVARDTSGNGGGGGALRLRFNGDTSAVYDRHVFGGNGSSPSAGSDINQTEFSLDGLMIGGGTGANIYGVGTLDIIDYASTTKNKTLRLLNGNNTNGTYGNEFIRLQSGNWRSTSAITSMTFNVTNGSGFESGTRIALYGIKGS